MNTKTNIRVAPESIIAYGHKANEHFVAMRTALSLIMHSAANVAYKGPNARQFKTSCGLMASSFAEAFNNDLAQIAESVSAATSSIAASLGGEPIKVAIAITPIDPAPIEPESAEVAVSTEALRELKTVIGREFQNLVTQLDSHWAALQATQWEGNAKDQVVTMVAEYTRAAKARAEEQSMSFGNFIDEQIMMVLAADQALETTG